MTRTPPDWTIATRQLETGWLADAAMPGTRTVVICRGDTEAAARECVCEAAWAVARGSSRRRIAALECALRSASAGAVGTGIP